MKNEPWPELHQAGRENNRRDPHWMREARDQDGRGLFWAGTNPQEKAHQNIERLVVVWNALRTVPTEDIPALVEAIHQQRKDAT